MTRSVQSAMKKRDKLYKKHCKCRSDTTWLDYKTARNQSNIAVRTAKREFFLSNRNKNPRKFCQNVKICTRLGKQKTDYFPLPQSTQEISKHSADLFNEFFISVNNLSNVSISKMLQTEIRLENPKDILPSKILTDISATEVKKTISELVIQCSPGNDGITSSMVKLSAEIISPIIADLFNMSLHTSKFPTTWKTSLVTPIYKKGNIYNISDYRPISILSTVSKLFEKLIERCNRDFVESNGILSKYQHGFRTKRSCQTALLSLTNILFSNRNNKQISAIAALDFSKAFDCMHHSILLNHLSNIGFGKLDIIWMDSYLSQRQQRVKYNGVLSDYRAISRESLKVVPLPHYYSSYIWILYYVDYRMAVLWRIQMTLA